MPLARPLLALIVSCFLGSVTSAQEMKLPLWMLKALSRESTPAEDSLADALLYAAFGVDHIQPNGFIGSFRMTVDITVNEGPMRIDVEHWSDTMKAVVRFIMPKSSGTLSYLVDLKANTAILAAEIQGRREATIYDLRSAALLNNVAFHNADKLVPAKGRRKETIAGQTCTEHTAQWDNETVDLWLSTIAGSPFVDASHWLPFGQSVFAIYTPPSLHGDPMPLRWISKPMRYEVKAIQLGPVPAPEIDLAAYHVKDERKRKSTGGASSKLSYRPKERVAEPAYYQALRERTRNAFHGSIRWKWTRVKPDNNLFKSDSWYTLIATPDTLLMLTETSTGPVYHATLCLRSSHTLIDFNTTGPPESRTYTPYVVNEVAFDAPVPKPTDRTKPFTIAMPLPAGSKGVDMGRQSATSTLIAHEYRSVTAEGDTLIAWIVPEIPSPFHDLYSAGHRFYSLSSWIMGMLQVDGLPLSIQRTNSKGTDIFSVIELGTGPVNHLLNAFARDTLNADLGLAIPDRPAIYEEAVQYKENRFTGHVHMVSGKLHPDSLTSGKGTHLDIYATKDRMLLVEKNRFTRRAWTIDRRTHSVVEYAWIRDELVQRPPLGGQTYPANYHASDTLEALGKDTVMLGLPCKLYRDPQNGARFVVATGIPSPVQDLYGIDTRYLRFAGVDTPWLQPVEGLVLHLMYNDFWYQVLEVDRSPVNERVFTITKETWRP